MKFRRIHFAAAGDRLATFVIINMIVPTSCS